MVPVQCIYLYILSFQTSRFGREQRVYVWRGHRVHHIRFTKRHFHTGNVRCFNSFLLRYSNSPARCHTVNMVQITQRLLVSTFIQCVNCSFFLNSTNWLNILFLSAYTCIYVQSSIYCDINCLERNRILNIYPNIINFSILTIFLKSPV